MEITIYAGPPGSGKSQTLLNEIATQPARVLWAGARTALLDEQAADCRAYAAAAQSQPMIEVIHSDQPEAKGSVRRRLDTALRGQTANHHVLMITHEALIELDPERVAGWRVIIDEVPEGSVASGCFPAQASWKLLEQYYDLVPLGAGSWWQVVPCAGVERLKRSEILQDNAKALVTFHQCVLTPGRTVLVDLGDWQDARSARRKVRWWSVWTPMSLSAAASVAITGAGFFTSLAYYAAQAIHGEAISFEQVDAPSRTQATRPTCRIRYFTRHRGSTQWWTSPEGSRCLVQISRHLEGIGFEGYWSCNEAIQPFFIHRVLGTMCEPKQAGTNSLRQHTACAYLYSAKAQEADAAILEVLARERDTVTRARESEDIIQFVMRGALRDPAFGGVYDVYVYSLDQAEMLKAYLREAGIDEQAELVAVEEAGIMEAARPAPKRTAASTTPTSSHRERQAARREKDAARKKRARAEAVAQRKAAGTHRRPGRPPGKRAEPSSTSRSSGR